jgi:hypothetical protein
MEFIKKHYEKVILGIVLVGLMVAVAFIPLKVASERAELEQQRANYLTPQAKPLPPLDLEAQENTLKRVAASVAMDFTTTNKLFNPMPWKRAADGHLIKDDSKNIGPGALTITKLTPLYLILTLDSVSVSDTGTRYFIGVTREAASTPSQRGKHQVYCSLNVKNEVFTLRKIEGPPENPTRLFVELNDTGETAVVSKEQPFRRIDGYMADFKYDPEKKVWPSRRVGSTLTFDGEDYKVVAITGTEAIISAPNQKKWTIAYSANAMP